MIRSFRYTLIFVLICSFSKSVLAHGAEPRLEISLDRANPGAVIDVRGVDFEPEEPIAVVLIGESSAFPMGEIIADEEGIFLHTVTLPPDLAEGEYRFQAITDDHEVSSPTLMVFGPPVSAEEGGEPIRDEDDPLLAPMPTFAPGVVPGGVSQPPAQPTPQTASGTAASPSTSALPGYFILVGLGVIGLIGIWVLKKR